MKKIAHIGLDVHKDSIAVAIADSGKNTEARSYGNIINKSDAIDKLIRKLQSSGNELRFVYEAGPCGYTIYRHLKSKGLHCTVVAPSLIPKKSGDRIKTDKRDAVNLARLFRAGELTSIYVPTEEDEAMRDLVRARADIKKIERTAQQRLMAFLLRHGIHYNGKTRWTKPYINWLAGIKVDHPAQQIVLQEYIDTFKECKNRIIRITDQIKLLAAEWSRAPYVEAYQALRGVALISAVTIVSEIGDMSRFKKPKEFMAFLGLVPSEHSSGGTVRRGGITKTGNVHVRKVLVEGAWTYRMRARKTNLILKRQEGLSEKICEISWKAQTRLCSRYRRLFARGKNTKLIVIAIAREMSAFIWAIDKEIRESI